jgi:hypothetical protein
MSVYILNIISFYLKLFNNSKQNIACWCEPLVNKLAAHPWVESGKI